MDGVRKHPLAECERCPLVKARCAPTSGPPGAKVAIVSRSPGAYDVSAGRPFAGESGKVLDHLLKMNGLKREEVLTTNVVLCRTDAPPKEAIDACRQRLLTEINASETIIAAGSESVVEFTGSKTVHAARGFAHTRNNLSGRPQRVIATSNPAVALRNAESYPDLVKDFKLALNPKPEPTLPEVNWTNDVVQAKRYIEAVSGVTGAIACDIEATGLAAASRIVAVGFSATGSRSLVFGERVTTNRTFFEDYLRPFIESDTRRVIWHNGKYDCKVLRWHGIRARVDEDTFLMAYALDERPGTHGLDYLLMDEFGWPNYEPTEVKAWKAKINRLIKAKRFKDLEGVETPEPQLYEYNGLDVAGTMQLHAVLKHRLDKYGMASLYRQLLLPASEALTQVELNGLPYDNEKAADVLESEVLPLLAEWTYDLREISQKSSLNPNSHVQCAEVIYDEFGVIEPSIKLQVKKDRSVADPIREELKAGRFDIRRDGSGSKDLAEHIRERTILFASRLSEFKKLDKQRGTYFLGLIPRREYYGRIYPSFNIGATLTGRLSGSDPNVQNVTRTKPGLPDIRGLFRAERGYRIVQADFSQAELRTIAELSQDPRLLEIYREGVDLHSVAAERIFGPDFTKEQRASTKNMNFGATYGQTAETFQEKHGVSLEVGRKHLKWWWTEFPGVAAWVKEVHREVRANNYVQTPFGRRRRFALITKENVKEVEREAVNFLVQSTAHDFTLWSLIQLNEIFDPDYIKLINEVHDSIVCETMEEVQYECASKLREIMESSAKTTLGWETPFTVDIAIGQDWGSVKEWEALQPS